MATKNLFRASRTGLLDVWYNGDRSVIYTKTAIRTRQVTQTGVWVGSNTIPDTVIFATQMSQKWNYFEIKIINEGSCCAMGIGVGPLNYSQQMMPGWGDMSIGYHADDGRLFISTGKGHAFGLCCHTGDTMGCGVDYNRQKHGYVTVWFTKNGELAGPPEKFPLPKDGLYPLIGLSTLNESVLYTGHSCVPPPYSEVPAALKGEPDNFIASSYSPIGVSSPVPSKQVVLVIVCLPVLSNGSSKHEWLYVTNMYSETAHHYHDTSLSYVLSLSYVTIIRHYHTSLSYVAIIRCYHTLLLYVVCMSFALILFGFTCFDNSRFISVCQSQSGLPLQGCTRGRADHNAW